MFVFKWKTSKIRWTICWIWMSLLSWVRGYGTSTMAHQHYGAPPHVGWNKDGWLNDRCIDRRLTCHISCPTSVGLLFGANKQRWVATKENCECCITHSEQKLFRSSKIEDRRSLRLRIAIWVVCNLPQIFLKMSQELGLTGDYEFTFKLFVTCLIDVTYLYSSTTLGEF